MVLRTPVQQLIRRQLATAKAARGYNWKQISLTMAAYGMPISANHLMAKMSRGSFKADEFVLIMRILGGKFIDLRDLELSGAAGANPERLSPGP